MLWGEVEVFEGIIGLVGTREGETEWRTVSASGGEGGEEKGGMEAGKEEQGFGGRRAEEGFGG